MLVREFSPSCETETHQSMLDSKDDIEHAHITSLASNGFENEQDCASQPLVAVDCHCVSTGIL